MERRNIAVPRAHNGEAVARILHDGLGVPHSTAKGLIDAGCVTINGRPARSHGQRCEGGDVVEVRFDPERRYEPHPPPRHGPGFRVVHEDPEIVVVDKTPGLLSSPAPGRRDESLAELIAESLRARGIRKPQLFVVHRLDQHTSGLLAFARTSRAMEWMAAQFESREAGRVYTAVVAGIVPRERGTIQSFLVENPKSLSVHTTPTRGAGKRAITHFAVMERFEDATLVRVGLETGRKHQIRVHFAEIGHPVLGDRRYGEPLSLLPRVALHAERLTFRHPRTLEKVTFEAPWPEDLTKLVGRLRRGSAAREREASAGAGQEADVAHASRAAGASGSAARERDAAPRQGSPFGRSGQGPEVLTRAEAERRAAPRSDPRRGPHVPLPVAVFPQGLTLTDPLGPTASHLLDPIAATAGVAGAPLRRGGGSPTGGGRRGPAPDGRAGAGPRGPFPDGRAPRRDRPARDESPSSGGFERRERLLRERSVGDRPPQRRAPSGGYAGAPPSDRPPRDRRQARGEGASESIRSRGYRDDARGGDKPRSGKPWSGARSEGKPRSDNPRSDKPWSGARGEDKPRSDKPWSGARGEGKPRSDKPWSGARGGEGKPRSAKPWDGARGEGKPPSGKPWSDARGEGKPRSTKPWEGVRGGDKPRSDKPWSDARGEGKPRSAKPWDSARGEGKPRSAKPWEGARGEGKPRSTKPWDGARGGDKPHSDKPRSGKPWSDTRSEGKPRSGKSWSDARGEGKPRSAKPWEGARSEGKPRSTKPWDGARGEGKPRSAKPWEGARAEGKPRSTKPWAGARGGDKPHSDKPRSGKPWSDARSDVKPRSAKPWSDARSEGKPRSTKPWDGARGEGKPRTAKPWHGAGAGSSHRPAEGAGGGFRPQSGKTHEGKPWKGKPATGSRPAVKTAHAHAPGGASAKPRHAGPDGARERKPWEFKEKGSTRRRERDQKIAAGRARGSKKGKKP